MGTTVDTARDILSWNKAKVKGKRRNIKDIGRSAVIIIKPILKKKHIGQFSSQHLRASHISTLIQ